MRSGIADYSLDLLPHLEEHCDIRLVHLPGQEVAASIRERFEVIGPDEIGADGRLPFYQMGNNHYHTAVYELALEKPGVLTLHDVVLHHLLVERTLKDGDFDAYRDALTAEHGWIGEATALPRRWPGGWADASLFSLPANRRLLAAQRGVLVHSDWARERLREELPGLSPRGEQGGKTLAPRGEQGGKTLRVTSVPMAVPLTKEIDPESGRDFRRQHDVPDGVPLLGSFGFQTPIKRTDAAIRALGRPGLEDVHLLIGGESSAARDLEQEARDHGVSERVHFLGFLPFEDFETAIAATDLCLNLRYPTAGETSASLLRILAVGKPAIVSEHAQFADLPDDIVLKVPPGSDEEEALAARLVDVLADPKTLRSMAQAARRHVATEHDPARAGAAIAAACAELAEAEPLGTVPDPAPMTSLFTRQPKGELEVRGLDPPWGEGTRRRLAIRLVNKSDALWRCGSEEHGGVALEVRLTAGDAVARNLWLRLPFDLAPGEDHLFEVELRRPRGAAQLRIEPHILGREGFASLGGPFWKTEV